MAKETELERITVKFLGNASPLVKETDRATDSVKKFSRDAQGRIRDTKGKFVSGFKSIGAAADTVDGKFNKLIATTGQLGRVVGQKLKKAGSALKSAGRTLTTRVTLPLIGAGVASFKLASDFETSMTKIESLVGLSHETVMGFRSSVLDLAGKTARAPQELADAMFFITSAGLRGKDALDALEFSAKAASAGLGDAVTIADLVTSAMNAYGPSVLGAAEATDVLTAAVREGKLDAPQLTAAFGSVLPLGSALGVEMHELGAAFAAMSRTGTNASNAATQIRAIFTSLLKPSEEAVDQLKEYGLTVEGLRDKMRDDGLLSTLELLSQKFDGNTEATAKVFGNVRALSGVLDLMGSSAEATRQIFENMANTSGTLDKAFETTAQTSGFKLAQFWAKLKTLAIQFGARIADSLMPHLEKLSQWLDQAITWWEELSVAQQENYLKWTLIIAAVGPVLTLLGNVLSVAGSLTSGIGKLGSSVAGMNIAWLGSAAAMGAALAAGVALGVWLAQFHPAVRDFNREMERSLELQSELAQKYRDRTQQILKSAVNAESPVDAIREEIAKVETEIKGKERSLKNAQRREAEFGTFARMVGNKVLKATQAEVQENRELLRILKERLRLLKEAGNEQLMLKESAESARKALEQELNKSEVDPSVDKKALAEKARLALESASPEFKEAILKVQMEEKNMKQMRDQIAAAMVGATDEQIAAVQNQILSERRKAESEAEAAARKAQRAAEKIAKTLEDKREKEQKIRNIIGDAKFDQIKSTVDRSLVGAPEEIKKDILQQAFNQEIAKVKKQSLLAFKVQSLKDLRNPQFNQKTNPSLAASASLPDTLLTQKQLIARKRKAARDKKLQEAEEARQRRKGIFQNLPDVAGESRPEELKKNLPDYRGRGSEPVFENLPDFTIRGTPIKEGLDEVRKSLEARFPKARDEDVIKQPNIDSRFIIEAPGEVAKIRAQAFTATQPKQPTVGAQTTTKDKSVLEVEAKKQTTHLKGIEETLQASPPIRLVPVGPV